MRIKQLIKETFNDYYLIHHNFEKLEKELEIKFLRYLEDTLHIGMVDSEDIENALEIENGNL